VVLDRRQGAFAPLPAGSDLMSPGNRRNPDRTDQTGRFGWDVLAGTYRVRASRRGCKAGRTGSLVVPPPRVGLVIRLRCAHISRVPTRLRIRVRRARGVTSLVARVTPASRQRGLPRGSVLFRAGGRSLGRLPVDPRSGTATATLRGKAPSEVRVAYSGDARFAPSRR
jgi:hypothetical protein